MRAARRAAPLVAGLALLACQSAPGPEFTPGSFIEKLRILGIRSTPADLAPGDETLIESLVVDPYAGARPLSFLWIICDPDPSGATSSLCANQDNLRGVGNLLGADGGRLPPGVTVQFIGDSLYYRAPDGLFDAFAPGSPERTLGLEATVLLVAYEGVAPGDLQNDDTVRQVALKRVRILPRGAVRNHNPTLAGLKLGEEPLLETAPPLLAPGKTVQLSAFAAADSVETYSRKLPDGTVLKEQEPMVFSWYTSAGAFDEIQRQSARTSEGQPIAFTAPAWAETQNGSFDLHVVLRDSRGGMDWTHRTLRVAAP